MSDSPFHSAVQFRLAFASGLQRLLRSPSLGGYILAHANAAFDPELLGRLRPDLLHGFHQLARQGREAIRAGREIDGAADDAAVFLRLMAIGFEGVQTTRTRKVGSWELQFNHLRAFRPPRLSGNPVNGISQPFDAAGFHFNRPFLRREVFWSGELLGEPVELLYNKFPFVPLHGLLVPDREAQHPQLLTRHYHDYVWRLCETLGSSLPGWGVGYNSYGAYASVNHLHFQTFLRDEPLPIAQEEWRHQGGGRSYPVNCEVYESATESWQRIESLHQASCSYNLIYRPGRLYCIPRRTQGSYAQAAWSSGFAWYEMAGGFATADRETFDGLQEETIVCEMGRLNLPS